MSTVEQGQVWRDSHGAHLVVVYVPAGETDTVWVCLSDQAGMPLDASTPIPSTHFGAWTLVDRSEVAA